MFRRAAVIGLAFAGLAVLGLAIAGSSSSADPRGCPPAGVGAEHANEHSRHYRCSTPTLTPTPASTPSPTATVTPTPLPTFSPTPSPPLSQTPTPTPLPTPSPPLTPIPTPTPTLPAGTPTPTPTPTLTPGPTPPFTFTNNTGTAASDLHFFAVAGESRPATLQVDNIVNPPGCPTPGVQVIGFTSIEPIFHVTLDWGEPCVDDGESATVDVSCTGSGTCTPTLFDGCADWTLSGTVIGTRCPFPPTPTPPPSPTP